MYAKVFTQIYDGTLVTKGPWQALVTFQQMLVLADLDGSVDMTAIAISRRTTIPLEIIELGIAELLKPDPESRTPDEGGRRIVPLREGRSWGWRVVNYKHYRALKREEDRREYHRDYWHKRKLKDSTQTQQAQPNQPIAEADTEAEAIHPPTPRKRGSVHGFPPGFDAFWALYPRKENKAKAAQAFARVHPDADLLSAILAALRAQAASEQWTRDGGQYIPHPTTWLNGRRWEDEGAKVASDSPFAGAL